LRQALPNADSFLQVDRQSLQWRPGSAETPWTLDASETAALAEQYIHLAGIGVIFKL